MRSNSFIWVSLRKATCRARSWKRMSITWYSPSYMYFTRFTSFMFMRSSDYQKVRLAKSYITSVSTTQPLRNTTVGRSAAFQLEEQRQNTQYTHPYFSLFWRRISSYYSAYMVLSCSHSSLFRYRTNSLSEFCSQSEMRLLALSSFSTVVGVSQKLRRQGFNLATSLQMSLLVKTSSSLGCFFSCLASGLFWWEDAELADSMELRKDRSPASTYSSGRRLSSSCMSSWNLEWIFLMLSSFCIQMGE